jgi:pyrroline-5-carboxylate reductase
MEHKIGFVGGGNIAASLIGGLLASGCPANLIRVAEPSAERRQFLATRFGIQAEDNGAKMAGEVEILVFAVKPQQLQEVAHQIGDAVRAARPLVISVVAGIRLADLGRWLGGYSILVRTMPNTPALMRTGATGLFAMPGVSTAQKAQAESLMRAVGITCWVLDENLIDSVTALSGSGPAYFFLLMEAMHEAGMKLGLDSETARLLTLQTAFGSAKMALESREPPKVLRERVTSPGGTTEEALREFAGADVLGLVERAMRSAAQRAQFLANELGKDK